MWPRIEPWPYDLRDNRDDSYVAMYSLSNVIDVQLCVIILHSSISYDSV